jgi:flagellar hook-associated protein 2
LAGSLAEDGSMIRFVTNKIRNAVFADSSTASGDVVAMRDIGVSVDRYGKIVLNENDFDAAILSNYTDIVTMLTADTTNQSLFDTSAKGLAQDIVTVLEDLTDATGMVTSRESYASTLLTSQQDELVKLEERMDTIYSRYLAQFGAMETLMASLDSTKDYLTSQFESLSKVYEVD